MLRAVHMAERLRHQLFQYLERVPGGRSHADPHDALHPKGESKYGEEREALIHPDAYPFLTRYFVSRQKHVKEIGATTRALFLGTVPTDGYLASYTTRMYADKVSKETGIDVNLRKCRRTYGQRLVDAEVPISVVSVVMGHLSTRTTEQHYARV